MTTALVTGIGGGGHGHEIVKALRLAGSYRIIGVDMSAHAFGRDDVDHFTTVPPAGDPDYVPALIALSEQHGVEALFHGSEPELKVIGAEREAFATRGIVPFLNRQDIIDLGLDKARTFERLGELGFTVPYFRSVSSVDDIPDDFPLPAVVKPSVGGGGSSNTYLVQDIDELRLACLCLIKQGLPVLIQEYVGRPNEEYTVGVLHTMDGHFVDSIAVRRDITSGLSNRVRAANRTGKAHLSPVLMISSGVSQGEIAPFEGVRAACVEIANALGSRGPLNIQCRYSDGHLFPFEINPRFSGTTYVRALVGFNEPDLMIRYHLLDEPVSGPIPYGFGRVVRGLEERLTASGVDTTKAVLA